MNIPVGIVTTAKRKEVLDKTLKSLGQDIEVHVFCDLVPGLYHNHKAAWFKLFEKSDRALLLQDDVLASKNWYKTVTLFADKFPLTPVIQFFYPFHKGLDDDGLGYIRSNDIWDQALLIKKSFYETVQKIMTPDILSKYEIGRRPGDYHHDEVLSAALSRARQLAVMSAPPVFQHQNPQSTVGNPTRTKGRDRISNYFIGEDKDSFEFFSKKFNVE